MNGRIKTEYKTIQIPKAVIDNAILLFPYFGYRNPHEFIIEAARIKIEKLIDTQYQLEKKKKRIRIDLPMKNFWFKFIRIK